jgi:microcystin-dependent protein
MEPYVGEIRLFCFNFAPQGWMLCDGRLLKISDYSSLYALIGITYGGDGQTTFALPNLCGRTPLSQGQGTNLTNRVIGQSGGENQVGLTASQMPAHNHALTSTYAKATLKCKNSPANSRGLANNSISGNYIQDSTLKYNTATPGIAMNSASITTSGNTNTAGSGLQHPNMQPYMALSYCIAPQGTYPGTNAK